MLQEDDAASDGGTGAALLQEDGAVSDVGTGAALLQEAKCDQLGARSRIISQDSQICEFPP